MRGDGDYGGGGEWAEPPPAEPPPRAFNAPWPPLLISALIVALYGLQSAGGRPEAAAERFGFAPARLAQGDWTGVVTALFVHGGWAHAILNSLGALAFGAPLARLFGARAAGALLFFGFFIGCGVLANLGYAGLHAGSPYLLVGASGGVSALMGGASRLVDPRYRDGRSGLAPFRSRTVVSMALSWIAINLAVAVVGLGALSGGAPIAWEAHLIGYAAGLLAVGPAARLMVRGRAQAPENH